MDYRPSGGIDLHIHSTASDGTNTPSEILEMAVQAGLRAIAITDHDTVDGCRAAFKGKIPPSLDLITGVEISVNAPENCPISDGLHILGYGINPEDEAFLAALDHYQQIRRTRIHHIVERLHQLGIPIDLGQVMEEAGEGAAGRPHIAEAMVKAGYAENINDAFDRYIGNGQPACVSKERMGCRDAFKLIEGAGGIAVLAHPYLISSQDKEQLAGLLRQLCDLGLKGLEVYYPKHSPEAVAGYLELALQFDLSVTGGTDFHGELIPEIKLGRGTGDLYVPYELYKDLLSRHGLKYVR